MKDLTKVFIDLSKLSEEQIKKIENIIKYEIEEIEHYPLLIYLCDVWNQRTYNPTRRTEISYPEFIKLFEGGEDNNGWIKIESEADLPKEIISCWFKRNNCEEIDAGLFIPRDMGDNSVVDNVLENCTHYQPIIKPEPPKF